MIPIVLQLQQDALDRNIQVSDLLRKALVVAKKLSLSEFGQWIENELNGYQHEGVPDYREVTGIARGWNPYHGWVPLIFENSEYGEKVSKRKTNQSIAELEHLARAKSNGTFQMPYSQEMQRDFSAGFGFETQVNLFVDQSNIIKIIDTVRNIILNWALKLEANGVLGEGFSFTQQEQNMAKQAPQIITNFYGSVQNAQLQQGNEIANQHQSSMNLDDLSTLVNLLSNSLPSLGLKDSALAEIQADISTIKSQLASPNAKPGILRESLSSIRSVLEGAAGGAAGQLLFEIGKHLL